MKLVKILQEIQVINRATLINQIEKLIPILANASLRSWGNVIGIIKKYTNSPSLIMDLPTDKLIELHKELIEYKEKYGL